MFESKEGLGNLASLERLGQIDAITHLASVTVDQGELIYRFDINDNSVTYFNSDWVSSMLVQNFETTQR
jgi:hypothetical protein